MSKQFRPMLAAEADLSKLRFPLIASPKLDGVRALVKDGVVLSRSLKPIPNKHVQKLFGRPELEGLDGELIVGSPTAPDCYRKTVSGVMSEEGEPEVRYFVFDLWNNVGGFDARLLEMDLRLPRGGGRVVIPLGQQWLSSLERLREYEERCLEQGFEGLILRDPSAPYKFGRSTVNEGYLLKLKRPQDSEAVVIGVEPKYHNANEATTNELGRTQRSSHKANKVALETMGRLHVRDVKTGVEFFIGTGFTEHERAIWWRGWPKNKGLLIKYKHFPVGAKEAPRHPVYLGLRDPLDL